MSVTARLCPDGPLLLRGVDTVTDEQGVEHTVTRPVVAVCTCGKSQRQPWCDATHKALGETMSTDFGGLAIAYDKTLLTPRPWTAAQSYWARELLPELPAGDVLELCSGAGQIGLLAVHGTGRRLVCVDVNPRAALYTRRNARAADVDVQALTGRARDVLAPGRRFALIIADPPWVTTEGIKQFPQDPVRAIDGGPDGLDIVRECLAAIVAHLAPGGVALLQLAPGDAQADHVAGLVGCGIVAGQRRHYPRGTVLRLDALASHAVASTP